MAKTIAIGSDHGGYDLKNRIIKKLERSGYRVRDMGARSSEPSDYPQFGYKVAESVSTGKAKSGIVICKSGIGMAIVANKLPGVRAGLCNSRADAVSSRQHNDANVLVLAASKISAEKAMGIVDAWLKTKALKGRHARRVAQIRAIEKKVFRKRI
jgi:RpiB/LacA/LacB family sugar-phosphate isomerase